MQLQESSADEVKKMSEEVQAAKALMKKAQLHAEEVQGTFDTHNGEYIRMKVSHSSLVHLHASQLLLMPCAYGSHMVDHICVKQSSVRILTILAAAFCQPGAAQ